VQPLELAGQDGRGDRLREQRMAEAEPPVRPVGDEHAALDHRTQRFATSRSGCAATATRSA
jgi:hypothetical protein